MLRTISPLAVAVAVAGAVLPLACSLEDLSNGTRPPDAGGGGSGGDGGAGSSTTTTTTSGGGGGAGPTSPCAPGEPQFEWVRGFGNENDQGTLKNGDINTLRLVTWNDGLVLATRVKGALDFGGGPLGDAAENVLVAAFAADGTHERSEALAGSAPIKALGGVAVSPTGRIAVVGSFQSGSLMAGQAMITAQAGAVDGFVMVSETDGSVQLLHLLGAAGDEGRDQRAMTVAFDGEALLVGGEFRHSLVIAAAGQMPDADCTLTGDVGSLDAFVLKLDDKLDCVAAFGMGGINYSDTTLAVAAGPNGEVVAGGLFRGSITLGTMLELQSTGTTSEDAFIVQLDGSLAPVWAKRFGGAGPDRVRQIAVSDGAVYLTGYHNGEFVMEGCMAPAPTTRGAVAARLGLLDGACAWAQSLGSNVTSEGRALTLTPSGFAVAGFFLGNIDLGDAGTPTSKGSEDGFLALLDGARGVVQRGVTMGSPGEESAEAATLSADGSAIYVAGTYASPFCDLPVANAPEDFFLGRLPLSP